MFNHLPYTIRLKRNNTVALVILLVLFCIFSETSFDIASNARNLQKVDRKLDDVQKESNFLYLKKAPISEHLDTISDMLQCIPTSQLKIFSKPDDTWILQSYTRDGSKKAKGGDEYYVTYKDNNNTSDSPSAVAHIQDNEDGTYNLRFVKSRFEMIAEMPMVGKGTITVFLTNTCGIGSLEPPSKNNWTLEWKNGAANAVYESLNHSMPVIKPPYMPKSYGHEFSQYDTLYVIGDSISQGIFLDRRLNIVGEFIMGTSLNTHDHDLFTNAFTNARKHVELQYGNNVTNKKLAIIFGSCVWDLLAIDSTFTLGTEINFEINDHLDAMKTLLNVAREQFSEFNLYWKGCTSLHHQAVHCWEDASCDTRNLYISSRRAKKLDIAQKTVAKEFNIPVLDMFDIAFEMGELNRDGRHFYEEWYQYVIDYFYPVN